MKIGNESSNPCHFKAVWTTAYTSMFCDVCIQAIEKGMRPSSHLNGNGWKFVREEFAKLSGQNYDRLQLKNKWDQMKGDWKMWKDLIGNETGLGWDSIRGTIDAPSSWWDGKLKRFPRAGRFRKKGIEPEFMAKYDIMFSNTVTPLNFVCPPSQEVLVDSPGIGENVPKETPEYLIKYNNSSDDLQWNTNPQVDALDAGNCRPSSKRHRSMAEGDVSSSLGAAQEFREDIRTLITALAYRAACPSKNRSANCPSLAEAVSDLQNIAELQNDRRLMWWAMDLVKDNDNREIYMSLRSNENKYDWIMYQHRKFNEEKNK